MPGADSQPLSWQENCSVAKQGVEEKEEAMSENAFSLKVKSCLEGCVCGGGGGAGGVELALEKTSKGRAEEPYRPTTHCIKW